MSTLSERIRELRGRKFSQAELAERIGVSTNTIWRWEAGQRMPNAVDLTSLAHALDTSTAYLLGETDDPRSYIVETTKTMGERIREQRRTLRLMRKDVTELTGIPEATLRQWEDGEATPDAESLSLLAHKLITSTAYLRGEIGDPRPAAATGGITQTNNGQMRGNMTLGNSGVTMYSPGVTVTPTRGVITNAGRELGVKSAEGSMTLIPWWADTLSWAYKMTGNNDVDVRQLREAATTVRTALDVLERAVTEKEQTKQASADQN